MHITIYVHDKPVFLCDKLNTMLKKRHHLPDTVFIDDLNAHSVKTMLRKMALPEISAGILMHKDLELLKKRVFKKFSLHVAGGGLVVNRKKEILLIFRKGYWDLPKGHQERGETIEECALREVREETGLAKLQLLCPLTITYHAYEQKSRHILKVSHWYLMKTTSTRVIPQVEEHIEKIEWVAPADLPKYLKQAYPSIRDVVHLYLNKV